MTDRGELRATSDLMLQMLERLQAAEVAKRDLRPGTREFADLAYRVVELSRSVTRWSELQLRQANELLGQAPSATSLVDTPKRRLDEVLAEWRQAEIQLSHAHPGSSEFQAAGEAVERLREEYRELQDRKMGERAPGRGG